MYMRFRDRLEAGQKLAEALSQKYKGPDVVVYALPRGGVVLGREIASVLGVPLDLVITRKIGHPSSPEYAICAVAEDGHTICNESEMRGIDERWFQEAVSKEREEARRRREVYLAGRPPVSASGKIVIIVDDGIATGLTMMLAIKEVKHQQPKRIVVAIPVAPRDSVEELRREVDDLVALDIPDHYLGAVGAYYEEFPQLDDEDVKKLLLG